MQEGRTGSASESSELARRDAGRCGPKDPITKGHDEGDRARVAREAREACRLASFGTAHRGFGEPLPGQLNGGSGQVVPYVTAVSIDRHCHGWFLWPGRRIPVVKAL